MRTGADLTAIRERKPLVHQITNYVVMNETANATLALGALPVMAHAKEEVAVVRGNAAEIATLVGREAEIRGVESIGAAESGEELARAAATTLGLVAAVTGPVDHVSDGDRVVAVSNGHELLGTVTGTGCMATAVTGCFLAVRRDDPLEAAAEALVAFGLAGEDAAVGAKGPGTFHAQLYDALYNLDPKTIDGRARVA